MSQPDRAKMLELIARHIDKGLRSLHDADPLAYLRDVLLDQRSGSG
jgi:hypothetical protein